MLKLILQLVLLLLAVRVVYSIFAGARQRARQPPAVPDDNKAAGRLGGKIVDADFEDLPGGGRKS